MDNLLYLLAPLGCGVMMVLCMVMMGRGMRHKPAAESPAENEEIAALRAEVAELRTERSRVDG